VHAHVLRHPYLDSLGLIVDPALACLCCESCKVALVPEHVDSHVKKNHGSGCICVNNNLLAEACQRLGASSELPCMNGPGIKRQYAGFREGVRSAEGAEATKSEDSGTEGVSRFRLETHQFTPRLCTIAKLCTLQTKP